nr:hypothetical protein [Tanacetum cinerariifolium]
MQLCLASNIFMYEGVPADVSDPDPLAFADAPSPRPADPTRHPEACQDLVDHAAPPGYLSELRHMHYEDFLGQYNINLARQVAMGSQLRLRFEQEAKLLRKSVAQVAHREQRIQARESEIKNLEVLLETEADMKRAAEEKSAGMVQELEKIRVQFSELQAEADMKKATKDRSAGLSQELEDMRAQFSDLQVSYERLPQQVATLQEQVSGEEKLKAAFEEFKRYEDSRVEQLCAKMDARLDALSIDFDEELYPHMLTSIAGRGWVIRRGLRLAVMKCDESLELRQAFADVVLAGIAKGMSKGLRHGVEHGQAQISLESIEAYDPEAEAKYVAALQELKDLNSSQLTIPVYSEVRDPMNPWACKEEMLFADAIAANISRAEKKKKCRLVCRTHGVGSAHHARSDGVPVSVPTVVPQGLALLLADAATQTELEEAT